jgi:hypothetical protein
MKSLIRTFGQWLKRLTCLHLNEYHTRYEAQDFPEEMKLVDLYLCPRCGNRRIEFVPRPDDEDEEVPFAP